MFLVLWLRKGSFDGLSKGPFDVFGDHGLRKGLFDVVSDLPQRPLMFLVIFAYQWAYQWKRAL